MATLTSAHAADSDEVAKDTPPSADFLRVFSRQNNSSRRGSPEETIGETINLLVHAGLASAVGHFGGQITIRRDWHC